MAVRMHQHAVLDRILAPMGSPHDMVVVPPRHRGDLLVANRTDTALLLPEQPQSPSARQAVRSGSLCGRRCLMLLLTCLFENPMSRRMVAEYARLHLLMPTTAGAGCFPPAIAPRAWQSLPHALAQLGRCRYLAQQREQRIHLDQLADCHHLPLHVVEQLLVGNLLRLTCLVRRQVVRTTCSALYISRQNDI